MKTFRDHSNRIDRALRGKPSKEDRWEEEASRVWNVLYKYVPETTDDTFAFLARKSDSAANWKQDIMLSLPSDDMTFEDTSFICRRTQFQLFNRLFRFDDYAERLEDFRFDEISERQREIAEKKAKRQANRKRHHRRGKKGKLKGNGKLAKETHLSYGK